MFSWQVRAQQLILLTFTLNSAKLILTKYDWTSLPFTRQGTKHLHREFPPPPPPTITDCCAFTSFPLAGLTCWFTANVNFLFRKRAQHMICKPSVSTYTPALQQLCTVLSSVLSIQLMSLYCHYHYRTNQLSVSNHSLLDSTHL